MTASSADKAQETADEGVQAPEIDYLTMPQLCKAIGFSRPAALRLLQKRRIIGYQAGGHWRIKKTEVRRFLEFGNHPNSD